MALCTPQSEFDNRPPKRMRLGTRSCRECRRRKVRCIFAPNSHVCEECALHEISCTPQQASRPGKTQVDENRNVDVHQRLEDLEGMVRRICKTIDLDIESSNLSDFDMSATEALRRLRPALSSEGSGEEGTSKDINWSSDQIDRFEEVPLLSLFRDAMLVQDSDVQPTRHRLQLSADPGAKACMKALNALIPSLDDLTSILEATEKYWGLWPVSLKSFTGSGRLHIEKIASTKDVILDSLRSESPAIVAKSVLWLALCIQQLPGDFQNPQMNLPASLNVLLGSYLSGSETLISVDESSSGTIDGLECLMLQARLYINIGRPRKAWLSIRRAMNIALLLGLQYPENSTDECYKTLWSQIWQGDRQLSLLLGLPYAIAESHPGLSNEHAARSIPAQGMYELAIIAGHIIERNQNHRTVNYSVTVEIDQQLEQCKKRVPQDWWDTIPSPSMPLEALYTRQVFKMLYYQLCGILHLPYMLKSAVDRKFENSRLSALEASREAIRSYQTLRNNSGEALTMCDVMDFYAFSAAIVIVIDLLSPSERDVWQHVDDWELVRDLSGTLKHVSQAMTCTVAGQASQLLEYLSEAYRGTYSGPEGYEAVIPYFGKVRISKSRRAASQTQSTRSSEPQVDMLQPFADTVEFSANSFMPFIPNSTADYLSEAELGIDWTSIFDVDTNYDWSQLSNNPCPG